MLAAVVLEEFVGRSEIREMLGVSRQRVHDLTNRRDFPQPVGELDGRPVWRRQDVERWARQTGRLG